MNAMVGARAAAFVIAGLLSVSATPAVELKSVGVSVSDFGNPFFVQIARSVEKTVAEIAGPHAEVTAVSSSYDLATQIHQINTFISAGVQLIVLNAADPIGILPVIRKAQQAGIVVVAVDVAAAGADVTVTSDNLQAGKAVCEYMAERLDGRGDVAIVNGPPVSSVIERVAGCKSALSKYPDIRILSDNHNSGGTRSGGLTVMTAILLAFSRLDAVFAINDPAASGADLAAQEAGRHEFFIVSVDGAPSAEEALQDETSLIAATAAQNPWLMARRGVEIGYGLLNGIKPEKDTVMIPTPLVTRKNVSQYRGWTPE